MPEYIHIFLSTPPQWKPSNIAKLLKGISSRWLLIEYPKLSTYKGRSKLWSPSYYIGTAGNITAQTIKKYIEECQNA
jgi:putative transposase